MRYNEEKALEKQHDEEDATTSEKQHFEEEACEMLKDGKCADEFSMMHGEYPSEHFCRKVCGFFFRCK